MWKVLFLFLSFSLYASQPTLLEYLSSKPDMHGHGEVLEELALLYMECEFGGNAVRSTLYYVDNNIKGELDILLLRKDAQIIAEVKNWKNIGKALIKARKQLERFDRYLEAGTISKMSNNVSPDVFYAPEYLTISYEGTDAYGFDVALPISYKETKRLFEELKHMEPVKLPLDDYCYLLELPDSYIGD